jgi:IS4 transposase
MENAASAINRLFAKNTAPTPAGQDTKDVKGDDVASIPSSATGQNVDETVDVDVAPAVEHKHVKKEHETREQTVIEKEKHQDHYHTTIQPLKDTEVLPEQHDYVQETKTKTINNDDKAAKAKAQADRAGFENTKEEKQFESKVKEPTKVEEHVHHHLHETVQPVIEKGKFQPKAIY